MISEAICDYAPTPAPSPTAGLRAKFFRLTSTIRSYRAFYQARAELMALDNRMLKDIGLDRSEITSALLNTAGERRNGTRTIEDRVLCRSSF